jgi:hypothetical protein
VEEVNNIAILIKSLVISNSLLDDYFRQVKIKDEKKYLAGKIKELNNIFNSEFSFLILATGGYGTLKLEGYLEGRQGLFFELLKKYPRVVKSKIFKQNVNEEDIKPAFNRIFKAKLKYLRRHR